MTLPAYHDLIGTLRNIADDLSNDDPQSEQAADIAEGAELISRLSKQAQTHKDWLEHIINSLRYPADVEQARSIAIQALNDLSK